MAGFRLPLPSKVVSSFVGATLVVARVRVMQGVGLANTGDHKGRPYGGTLRHKGRPYERTRLGFPARQRMRVLVGARLVLARLWASKGLGSIDTGYHKGRPYGAAWLRRRYTNRPLRPQGTSVG